MKGVDRAAALLGSGGNSEAGMENEVNGLAFDFGRKVETRHEVRAIKAARLSNRCRTLSRPKKIKQQCHRWNPYV